MASDKKQERQIQQELETRIKGEHNINATLIWATEVRAEVTT